MCRDGSTTATRGGAAFALAPGAETAATVRASKKSSGNRRIWVMPPRVLVALAQRSAFRRARILGALLEESAAGAPFVGGQMGDLSPPCAYERPALSAH